MYPHAVADGVTTPTVRLPTTVSPANDGDAAAATDWVIAAMYPHADAPGVTAPTVSVESVRPLKLGLALAATDCVMAAI
jgi:hypothetical protein